MANGYDDTGYSGSMPTTANDLAPGTAFMGGGATPDFGFTMDPTTSTNQLVKPPVQPDKPTFSINDISKQTNIGNRYGAYQNPPVGMIIHHTGPGYSTAENLGKFFYNSYKKPGDSGVASNFTIDRNGQIYQLLPDGMRGQHIQPGWGAGNGLNNGNVEGVEIMANGDKDVTPLQQQAAAWLVGSRAARYGWNPTKAVWGHGEVNPGHKEADEGMTVANAIRNGTLVVPAFPTQGIQPQAGPGQQASNQLGGVTVPQNIAPFLNYWADYHNLDRGIFSRMINYESSFNPNAPGTSGEIGLGQLMPDTATGLGLKVERDAQGKVIGVDERHDINKNLMASAAYLRQMLDDPRVQGDYRKALMLYNSGPNAKTPFQNTAYADAVLGGGGGGTAGPGPAGGRVGPMQVAGGAGGYEADMPAPQPNALKPGPKEILDRVAGLQAEADRQRRLQNLMMFSSLLQQLRGGPAKPPYSGYDPAKVQESGRADVQYPPIPQSRGQMAYSSTVGTRRMTQPSRVGGKGIEPVESV